MMVLWIVIFGAHMTITQCIISYVPFSVLGTTLIYTGIVIMTRVAMRIRRHLFAAGFPDPRVWAANSV
jgi:hypothetical protein